MSERPRGWKGIVGQGDAEDVGKEAEERFPTLEEMISDPRSAQAWSLVVIADGCGKVTLNYCDKSEAFAALDKVVPKEGELESLQSSRDRDVLVSIGPDSDDVVFVFKKRLFQGAVVQPVTTKKRPAQSASGFRMI